LHGGEVRVEGLLENGEEDPEAAHYADYLVWSHSMDCGQVVDLSPCQVEKDDLFIELVTLETP
jgi:hypothetical protein